MKRNAVLLAALALALPALAKAALAQNPPAPLPLKEGRYSAGGCERFSESDGYIGLGQHRDGPDKGLQFLVPQAEKQQGVCTLRKLAPMGAVLAGVAECDSGGKVNPRPLGTYRFNYTVHGPMSFTSLGKRYEWCPSRR